MGPLEGVKVLELAGIGPGPFAGMLLADMGADVLRVYRADQPPLLGTATVDTVSRGRAASIPVDLKDPAGVERVLELAEQAEALIEGMRPGVMERLGLGPEVVLERNPRLVYGRMTGYGQQGPLSRVAGHDINYISIAGALGAITRRDERPLFPLNLLADYGGGAMFLAFGIVCGVLEARSSGKGQVVDAAMVDGVALLTNIFHGLKAGGLWTDPPGTNVLDSGAHFYEVYESSDGGHIAVGAIEPQFYATLLALLEIDPAEMPQWDRERWPEFKQRLDALFRTRTRAQWSELLEPADACATAVLGLGEAPEHPHMRARGTFVDIDGIVQPGPAPRFSRTPGQVADRDALQALERWGLSASELASAESELPSA
ncbi:MAG: CaiB/BaiF CoA transferase family protein [Solirubrobacteraceae bacterium]